MTGRKQLAAARRLQVADNNYNCSHNHSRPALGNYNCSTPDNKPERNNQAPPALQLRLRQRHQQMLFGLPRQREPLSSKLKG